MMEAASTSEMLVNVYETTWYNIAENGHLHNCPCEKIKSHWKNLLTNN
jgi:hypothetical protein